VEGRLWARGEGKGVGRGSHTRVRPLSQILDTPLSTGDTVLLLFLMMFHDLYQLLFSKSFI
jgi:hypothetical protein